MSGSVGSNVLQMQFGPLSVFSMYAFVQLIKYTQRTLHLLLQIINYMKQFLIWYFL